jgi:hypothetical protein
MISVSVRVPVQAKVINVLLSLEFLQLIRNRIFSLIRVKGETERIVNYTTFSAPFTHP